MQDRQGFQESLVAETWSRSGEAEESQSFEYGDLWREWEGCTGAVTPRYFRVESTRTQICLFLSHPLLKPGLSINRRVWLCRSGWPGTGRALPPAGVPKWVHHDTRHFSRFLKNHLSKEHFILPFKNMFRQGFMYSRRALDSQDSRMTLNS